MVSISVPLVLCFSAGVGHHQTTDVDKAPAEAAPLPGGPSPWQSHLQCAGLPLSGRAAIPLVCTLTGHW